MSGFFYGCQKRGAGLHNDSQDETDFGKCNVDYLADVAEADELFSQAVPSSTFQRAPQRLVRYPFRIWVD